jgi:hypothetical protein
MNALIVCPKNTLTPVVTAEAEVLISMALEGTEEIQSVTTAQENALANAKVSEVSALKKQINTAHKEAKEPFLRACQALDAAKKKLLDRLDPEELRVNTLCGNYVQEQLEVQREAERARLREVARIEAATAEAQQQANSEAERQTIAELAEQEKAALPEVAPIERTAGQVVKPKWVFQVVDIWKLVKARHDLVRVEANTSAINEELAAGVREIPGLLIKEEVKAYVKLPATRKVIEV